MINTRHELTGADNGHQEPPAGACPASDRPISISEDLIHSTIDSLERIEEFFRRYANPSVREDLRAYAKAQGWHPTAGAEALLDGIGFAAHNLSRAVAAN